MRGRQLAGEEGRRNTFVTSGVEKREHVVLQTTAIAVLCISNQLPTTMGQNSRTNVSMRTSLPDR